MFKFRICVGINISIFALPLSEQSALVAQLVARRSDKAKVIGSSPVESTFIFDNIAFLNIFFLPTLSKVLESVPALRIRP